MVIAWILFAIYVLGVLFFSYVMFVHKVDGRRTGIEETYDEIQRREPMPPGVARNLLGCISVLFVIFWFIPVICLIIEKLIGGPKKD